MFIWIIKFQKKKKLNRKMLTLDIYIVCWKIIFRISLKIILIHIINIKNIISFFNKICLTILLQKWLASYKTSITIETEKFAAVLFDRSINVTKLEYILNPDDLKNNNRKYNNRKISYSKFEESNLIPKFKTANK